jgi:hypothetical protein
MGGGDLSDAERELIGPLLPSERGRWARPADPAIRHRYQLPTSARIPDNAVCLIKPKTP